MEDKGLLISFEGIDGSGKSSVAKKICDTFNNSQQYDRAFILVDDVHGSKIGSEIRTVIMDPANRNMNIRTKALLYAAARGQVFSDAIQPLLDAGDVAVCDRYVDSTLAYEGYAAGLGIDDVLMINRFAVNDRLPDLTFYFDIDAETGLSRSLSRVKPDNKDPDVIEYNRLVTEGYHKLIARDPDRFVVIDVSGNKGDVIAQVEETLKDFLAKHPESLL